LKLSVVALGLAVGGASSLAQPSQTDQPSETPQGQSNAPPASSSPPAANSPAANPPATSSPSDKTLEPLVVEKPAPQQRRTVPVANTAPSRTQPVVVPNRNPSAPSRTQRTAGPTRAPRAAPAQSGPSQGAQSKPETGTGPVKGYVATRSDTAMKTDTPIIETPQSIEVVPKDQFEAQQVWTAKDALRYSAGINSDTRGNFGLYDVMYNRGFPVDRYLDGMKLQGNTGYVTPQVDLYGMERVELLRGPASVMYGQGSPAGLVNMVSKRPLDQPFGEIELQSGSYDRFQGAFDVGGRVDPDGQYLWRLTGDMRNADNQVQFVQEEHRFIAPAFTWHPTSDTTLTILANYQSDPKGGLYNFVPSVGSIIANPNGQIPTRFYAGDPNYNQINRTQYGAGYLFEQNIDPIWTFRSGLRYLDTNGTMNQVLPITGGLESDNATLDRYILQDGERVSSFTTDNNLQAKFATGPVQHTMLFGVDYQQTLFTQLYAQDFGPSINIYNPAYYQPIALSPFAEYQSTHQKQEQTGVYVQEQAKFGNLILVGAGRRDHAHSDTLFGDTYTQPIVGNTEQNDYATTGRVGAILLLGGGWAPYAVHATSFNPTLGTEFGGTPFKPTTGTLNEGGVRYAPDGLNLLVTASYYDIVEQNVPTVDPAHLGFNIQTGEIRSNGWEFEARASVTSRLDLIASYTYINAKVTQSNNDDFGKVPIYVPRNMASGWADYTFRDGALNGLGFAVGVRFIGYTYGDMPNTEVVPGYTLTDAALHYELEGLRPELKGYRFSVNASNVFDKVYVSECSDTNCLYGLRRKVLATLRYRW
jgi:iron complex outermembrane recepter protein